MTGFKETHAPCNAAYKPFPFYGMSDACHLKKGHVQGAFFLGARHTGQPVAQG